MIVHDFVENRQLPEDPAVSDAWATRQRKDVPTRLSVLLSEMVRIPTSFGSDRITVDVPRRPKAYNAIRTKGKYKINEIKLQRASTQTKPYKVFPLTQKSKNFLQLHNPA